MRREVTFLEALQAKTARTTITSSSMRGPGCVQAIEHARAFAGRVVLRRFSCRSRAAFIKQLDEATAELLSMMPRPHCYWGLARKGINIFLRECLYTAYLRDAARLSKSEHFFELPLDSFTGKALRATDRKLPRWDTVRRLTPSLSAQFQDAATLEGKRRGIARVHLDVFWWGHRGNV